jgi:hypothetical protein
MNVVEACVCEKGDYVILDPKMKHGKYTSETCAIF